MKLNMYRFIAQALIVICIFIACIYTATLVYNFGMSVQQYVAKH